MLDAKDTRWVEIADRLDRWWVDVIGYCSSPNLHEFRDGWSDLLDPIVDFCFEHTNIDPSPLWLIQQHITDMGAGDTSESALSGRQLQLDRSMMLVEYFARKARGVEPSRPAAKRGARPKIATEKRRSKVLARLKEGITKPEEISNLTGIAPRVVSSDIARLKKTGQFVT